MGACVVARRTVERIEYSLKVNDHGYWALRRGAMTLREGLMHDGYCAPCEQCRFMREHGVVTLRDDLNVAFEWPGWGAILDELLMRVEQVPPDAP